jgi:N-acetylmuramoyl-L-alanine amidase
MSPPKRAGMFGRLRGALAAALLAAGALGAGTAHAALEFPAYSRPSEGIRFAGGAFADTTFEEVPYVSAEFLTALFGHASRWEAAAQQLRLKDGRDREWSFTLDNPFVSIGSEVFNLTYPVRRGPERVYLPLHPLLRLLRTRYDVAPAPVGIPVAAGAVSPSASATVPAAPVAAAHVLTDMTLEDTPTGSVLRVIAPPGTQWQGVRSKSHYLLRAFDSRLAAGFPARLTGGASGTVERVDALQEGSVAQFTIRLRGSDSVELLPQPDGYQVRVRAPEKPAAGPRSGTIILDAGHGGKDRGAVKVGAEEAVITLAVTKRLQRELEDLGYRVRLTREDDVYKTLAERPKFASDNNGDVFVSLHCNSLAGSPARLASVTGWVSYILREGESEEDKAIARRENQAIELSGAGKKKAAEISPLDWILLEHQLNLYSKQSEALAESIDKHFADFDIPRYSTGARQAGFFVLVGAYMPAVLFEMGFLTHERDRRVLASADGQQGIAERMAKAIDAFQRSRAK